MLWERKKIGPSILCWWKYKLVQPLGKSITEGKIINQKTYVKSCHSAQKPLVAPFQSVKSNHVLAVGYLDPTASPTSPSMTAWLTGLHHIAPSPLTHTPSMLPHHRLGPGHPFLLAETTAPSPISSRSLLKCYLLLRLPLTHPYLKLPIPRFPSPLSSHITTSCSTHFTSLFTCLPLLLLC